MVELVVVIILLGVLAVTALPRFIDTDDAARVSAARATMGAFTEGVNLLHSLWLTDGGNASSLVVDGVTVPFNAAGWPKSQVSNTADCIATSISSSSMRFCPSATTMCFPADCCASR